MNSTGIFQTKNLVLLCVTPTKFHFNNIGPRQTFFVLNIYDILYNYKLTLYNVRLGVHYLFF